MDAMHDQGADASMTTSDESPQAFGGRRHKASKSSLTPQDSSHSLLDAQGGRSSAQKQVRQEQAEAEEDGQERQNRRVQLDQDLSIFGFSFRKKKTNAATATAPFKRVTSSSKISTVRDQPSSTEHDVTGREEREVTSAVEPGDSAATSTHMHGHVDEADTISMVVEAPASDLQGIDHGEQNTQEQHQIGEGAMTMDQDPQNAVNGTNGESATEASETPESRHQLVWRGSWIAPSLVMLQESDLSGAKKRTTSSTSLARRQLDLQQRSSLARDCFEQKGLRPLVQELKGIAMVLSQYSDSDKTPDVSISPEQPLVADGSMEMHVIAKIQLSTFPSYLLDIRHRHGAYEVFISGNSVETIHYFQGVFGQSGRFEGDGIGDGVNAHGTLLGDKGLLVRAVCKTQMTSFGRSYSFAGKTPVTSTQADIPEKQLIQDSQMFLVYGVLDTTINASMDDLDLGVPENGNISLYAYPLVDHSQFSAQSLFNQPVMDRLETEYIEYQPRRREHLHSEASKKEPEESSVSIQSDDPELEAIMCGAKQLELSNKPSTIMEIDEGKAARWEDKTMRESGRINYESQWEETILLEALERNKVWKPYIVPPPSSSSPSPYPHPGTPTAATSTDGLSSRHKALDSLSSSGVSNKRAFSRSHTMVEAGSGSGSTGTAVGGAMNTLSRHQSLDSHHHRRRKGDEALLGGGSQGGSSSSNSRRTRETASSGRDKVTEALRRRLLGPGSIRKSSDQGRLSLPPTKTKASRYPSFDDGQEPSSPSRRRQSTGAHRTTTPTGRSGMKHLAELLLDHGDDDMEEGGDVGEEGGMPVFQERLSRSLLTSPSARTSRARRRVTMGGGGTEGMDLKAAAAQASLGGSSRRKSNPPVRMATPMARTKSASSQDNINPFWAPSAPTAASTSSSSKTPESVPTENWLSRVANGSDDEDSGVAEEDQASFSVVDDVVSTSPVKSLFVYDQKNDAKGKQRAVDNDVDATGTSNTLDEDKPMVKTKAKSVKEQNEHTIKSLIVATLCKHGIREDQQDYEQCAEMLTTSAKFSMRRDIETKLYSLHEVEQVMDRAAALL
ncbi:hypothetical protein BGZ73_008079 [Actinomortierella ambigua]|nr:hypothetical protein BGZ73_008079 [Actinomortierella ambigua]